MSEFLNNIRATTEEKKKFKSNTIIKSKHPYLKAAFGKALSAV